MDIQVTHNDKKIWAGSPWKKVTPSIWMIPLCKKSCMMYLPFEQLLKNVLTPWEGGAHYLYLMCHVTF